MTVKFLKARKTFHTYRLVFRALEAGELLICVRLN